MITRDELLHLVDRAERGRLLPAEATLLRDGILALTDGRPSQPEERRFPRPFVLYRPADPTIDTPTGDFAEGVVWTDSTAVLRWRGEPTHVSVWASLADALHVNGAEGMTSVQWPDTDQDDEHPAPRAQLSYLSEQADMWYRGTLDSATAMAAVWGELHGQPLPTSHNATKDSPNHPDLTGN